MTRAVPPKPRERSLMQLSPSLRAGPEHQQSNRFAAETDRKQLSLINIVAQSNQAGEQIREALLDFRGDSLSEAKMSEPFPEQQRIPVLNEAIRVPGSGVAASLEFKKSCEMANLAGIRCVSKF